MAIKKKPVSPRQKMINLMYVVLMAMLALNVSTEVLNGFSIVEESLNRTTVNSAKENQVIYDDFEAQMKSNPAKVKAWFDKAQEVRHMSDSLYNFAEELKLAIVREADGKNGDVKKHVSDNLYRIEVRSRNKMKPQHSYKGVGKPRKEGFRQPDYQIDDY